MLSNSIVEILSQTWPMIAICLIILVSLRLGYIIKNKTDFKLYKELITLCFVIYFMCLFYIVTFQDVSWSGSNMIPFKEMLRYSFGTKAFIKNILGNMLLLVPYGLAIGYYIDVKKIRHAFLLGLLLSCSIESIQYVIGRVFDVDDIILNVLGCILGFSIYRLFDRARENLPSFFRKEIVYNIVILIVMVMIFLYLLFVMGVFI